MNKEKINNIVILKEIQSNIIDEAIFILKTNSNQNKKRAENYAQLEGTEIIKRYLQEEKIEKKAKKRKKYLFCTIGIAIFILILLIKHIH